MGKLRKEGENGKEENDTVILAKVSHSNFGSWKRPTHWEGWGVENRSFWIVSIWRSEFRQDNIRKVEGVVRRHNVGELDAENRHSCLWVIIYNQICISNTPPLTFFAPKALMYSGSATGLQVGWMGLVNSHFEVKGGLAATFADG
jgi:hypothetical protein